MPLKKQVFLNPSTTFKTVFGLFKISWSPKGITSLKLLGENISFFKAQKPIPSEIRDAIQATQKHLTGELQDLSVFPLDFFGTGSFFTKVYQHTRKIPCGTTLTYCKLAKEAGSPKAARAVGQAMARNPFLLFVPCHRIISTSKKLGGFSAPGGVNTKRALLQLEGNTDCY